VRRFIMDAISDVLKILTADMQDTQDFGAAVDACSIRSKVKRLSENRLFLAKMML